MHVYQVQNRGPSTINQAHVTILWPSLTSDNQHLLYLLDQPVVSGKGSCQTITLDEVNPLRLPVSGVSPPLPLLLFGHICISVCKVSG